MLGKRKRLAEENERLQYELLRLQGENKKLAHECESYKERLGAAEDRERERIKQTAIAGIELGKREKELEKRLNVMRQRYIDSEDLRDEENEKHEEEKRKLLRQKEGLIKGIQKLRQLNKTYYNNIGALCVTIEQDSKAHDELVQTNAFLTGQVKALSGASGAAEEDNNA